jgi:hypothetical protein
MRTTNGTLRALIAGTAPTRERCGLPSRELQDAQCPDHRRRQLSLRLAVAT